MTWKGLSFPFAVENGGVKWSSDEENIKQSIYLILSTRKKERPFRPDFGSNLFDLVDAPYNAKTRAQIVAECIQAIREYEPRVKLQKVYVNMPGPGQVAIQVNYVVNKTGVEDTLTIFWDRVNKKWAI